MHNFRKLNVWHRAMALTIRMYRETASYFPADERFGLTSQMRRACTSIPLNIAEGSGNSSNREFCRFLEIAIRSGYEVITAIEIARGLCYWPNQLADELATETSEVVAMAIGLKQSLEKDNNKSVAYAVRDGDGSVCVLGSVFCDLAEEEQS